MMNNFFRLFLFFTCISLASNAQDFQLAKRIGGSSFENAMGIALDGAGNIIVSGYFAGTADFDPDSAATHNLTSNGSNDVFLASYDATGNFRWAVNIGGPYDEFTYANPVVDSSGHIYVCGIYGAGCDFDGSPLQAFIPNQGSNDGFVVQYDSSGIFQWAKGFGGILDDDVYGLDVDADNNLLFAGSFKDTADLNPGTPILNFISSGGADVFFGKLDPAGALLFVNVMNGTKEDRSYQIVHDLNNDIVLTGGFNDTLVLDPNGTSALLIDANGSSSFIAKFSSSGSYQWAFALSKAIPFGLCIDHGNNILTSGQFSGPTDFDPGLSTHTLSGQSGSYDAYMAKYNSSGNYVFSNRFGGNQLDCAYAIHELADSTIAMSGFFNLTADFDPSASFATLTSAGAGDIFLGRYGSGGTYLSAFRIGSTGFDFTRNMAMDSAGAIYIAGGFDGTVDFDPATPVFNLVSAGSRDGFYAKFGSVATGITTLMDPSANLVISPNPFAETIHFYGSSLTDEKVSLAIFNMMGEKILEKKNFQFHQDLQLPLLPCGMYNVQVTGKKIFFIKKILKN